MTEQEKTELAMKKSQGEEPTAPNSPEAEQAKETKEIKAPLAKNELQLGSRVITISPWTGKTKKRFKKEFEFATEMSDVDFTKILDILVYDHFKEDFLLTDKELQYVLGQLKIISISDEATFEATCPSCNAANKITTGISENVQFNGDTLPAKHNGFEFLNISKTEFDKLATDILESDDYDGLTTIQDLEVAAKIQFKGSTPKETINILDELSIKDIKDVMSIFGSHLAVYDLSVDRTCTGCQTEQNFEVEIITGIFETLAE